MAAILKSAILDSVTLVIPLKLTHTFQDWFPPFAQKNFPHSFWLNLMMAAILNSPSWIQTPCFLLWDSLKNNLTPFWLWLKLIQSDSNSFILIQLDDGSHPKYCHLGFSHLNFSFEIHSHLPRLVPTICTKNPSLIHSDSTWWWQPSWTLPCCIQTLPSWIQTPCYLLSDSLKNTLTPLWLWLKLILSHLT